MILVEKADGNILIEADTIKDNITSFYANGNDYLFDNTNGRYEIVNAKLPYGKLIHWRYINGTLELTEVGATYTQEIEVAKTIELQNELSNSIQDHLDRKAQEYRYDNIKSARAMAGVPLDGTESVYEVSISNQAISLAKWDRAVWAKATEIEEAVLSGTRAMPTIEELILELPILVLP